MHHEIVDLVLRFFARSLSFLFEIRNSKTLILKKLFAQKIGWMPHPAEPEPDSSTAVVPADEADAGASDAESSKNTALRIMLVS